MIGPHGGAADDRTTAQEVPRMTPTPGAGRAAAHQPVRIAVPPAGAMPCPAALAGAALLGQCARFIDRLDDAAYTRPSRAFGSGTIGKHLRHSLDHFAAPIAVLDRTEAVIEYDRRARGVPMETDRAAALAAIERLAARLSAFDQPTSALSVTVRVMLTEDGATADLASTIGRELAFATHHAVHHCAMMRAIAEEFGLTPPDGFGKAPATLHHEHHHD